MSSPSAVYSSPYIPTEIFEVDPKDPHYQTTNGKTTGPSAYVLNAGQIDKDKPSDPKMDPKNPEVPTQLSKLRMELTGIQDDINEFLTKQMEVAKNKRVKVDVPKQQPKKKINEFGEEEVEEDEIY